MEPAEFIRSRLPLAAVPGLAGIVLHTATPSSGLGRFVATNGGRSPYWGYPWAGGLALAHHLRAHPETVAGQRVLDLGAGGGLVGIAAAKAGAAAVLAAEIDPLAIAALRLNTAANGVQVDVIDGDLLDGEVPDVTLVCAGDLFYEANLARRASTAFARWQASGLRILVGDPGRPDLPLEQLRLLASYELGANGFGEGRASVYRFTSAHRHQPPLR